MSVSARLLASLERIAYETTLALHVLADAESALEDGNRKEVKRQLLEIRDKNQELFDWIAVTRLDHESVH